MGDRCRVVLVSADAMLCRGSIDPAVGAVVEPVADALARGCMDGQPARAVRERAAEQLAGQMATVLGRRLPLQADGPVGFMA